MRRMMSKKYKVIITRETIVEAKDEEEAKDMAFDSMVHGDVDFEVEEDEQKTRRAKFKSFNKSQPLAPGTRAKLQAASNKLQAPSRKLDKKII